MDYAPCAIASVFALSMCGCHALNFSGNAPVTKIILVHPVEQGSGITVEPVAEFLGSAEHFSLRNENKNFEAPLNWLTECHRDGTMRITWTSRKRAKEKLFLTEAGFHAVEVPVNRALVIDRKDAFSEEPLPITLRMSGNTAFLPKSERHSYRAAKMKNRIESR